MDTRQCVKCGEVKPLTEFHSHGPERKDKTCKVCRSIEDKIRYRANSDRNSARGKLYRAARKERGKADEADRVALLVRARVRSARYRATGRLGSESNTFTAADWIRATNYFHGVCAYCGNPPSFFDQYWVLHQDHFIPLALGGAYVSKNILPCCKSCNLSKADRDPIEWLTKKLGKRKATQKLKEIRAYFDSLEDIHD